MKRTSPTLARVGSVAVEDVSAQILTDCLVKDGSLLTPDRSIWTVQNLKELHREYVDAPDVSAKNFGDKLTSQLAATSDDARQLFAEIYILNVLPLSNFKQTTKLGYIKGVLDGLTQPVALPDAIADAFRGGVFNGGRAFSSRRWAQLSFLVEFAENFKAQSTQIREEAAREPESMRQLVLESPGHREPAQRQALLYLFHPDYFLPIVSTAQRELLRDKLAPTYLPTGVSDDLDADLRAIDDTIATESGGAVDYYTEPWRSKWLQPKDKPLANPATTSAPSADIVDPDDEEETSEAKLYSVADIVSDGAFHPADRLQQILKRWEKRRTWSFRVRRGRARHG